MERIERLFGHLDYEVIQDEKSAFKPFQRPGFANMLERLQSGERTGIIAWHPDRLSRNEIDASSITYSLRTGVIKDLLFASYTFENSPEGIMFLQLALSQSQYESAKKGKDVKRGELQKCKMGWRPGKAPLGYINYLDPVDNVKKIKIDEQYRDSVKQMFRMMLQGTYTPPQILKIATNEWGLRTPGGNKISRSGIYYLFTRQFYCGRFEYPKGSGNWYKGKHEPYITNADFEHIQRILGREGKPHLNKYKHAYTGIIRCADKKCSCLVTQEFKRKVQKNGNVHHYYFAHCTRRKPGYKCTQPSIRVEELERQISEILRSIELPPEFHSFAMKWIKKRNAKESESVQRILESRQKAYNALERKKSGLIDMRAFGEITSEEFRKRRSSMEQEMSGLEFELSIAKQKNQSWVQLAEDMFLFLEKAVEKFDNGTLDEKRAILTALGSNFMLKDKKLFIDLHSCLFPMKIVSKTLKDNNATFEPQKTFDINQEGESHLSVLICCVS